MHADAWLYAQGKACQRDTGQRSGSHSEVSGQSMLLLSIASKDSQLGWGNPHEKMHIALSTFAYL